MKRIKLATLMETAELKPAGYLEAVLAPPARVENGWVLIPPHRYSALRLTYATARPTLWQKTRGLFREMIRWKSNGFRIAHWRVFLSRSRACKGCPFTVPVFFGMLNTCGRCGCTRAKLWLETARCPEGRWRS